MNRELSVSKSIVIQARPESVWKILTDPEQIKAYLFGTETITDWKVNSPIIFQGEYDGNKYPDKGNVLENEMNRLLRYNYWSGFSGLEDKAENYSIVTYLIESTAVNRVTFTWTQEGFATIEGQQHMESGLAKMLEQIKTLAEAE